MRDDGNHIFKWDKRERSYFLIFSPSSLSAFSLSFIYFLYTHATLYTLHSLQQYDFLSHCPGVFVRCSSCSGQKLKAQTPENNAFSWPCGDKSLKAQQRGREQSCKGGIKAKCKNHITSWHPLPERSWRRAHSASGPPSPAPWRSGAGTGTRCSALQRPAQGPGLIWRVSWKRIPSPYIHQLPVPVNRDSLLGKKQSLLELRGAAFFPSLSTPWLLLAFIPLPPPPALLY